LLLELPSQLGLFRLVSRHVVVRSYGFFDRMLCRLVGCSGVDGLSGEDEGTVNFRLCELVFNFYLELHQLLLDLGVDVPLPLERPAGIGRNVPVR